MNVTIISGDKDAGKTTALIDFYNKQAQGDGVASVKVYHEGRMIGFDLHRLATAESTPFARVPDMLPKRWSETIIQGRFSFSQMGFDFARSIIQETIDQGRGPVYIDEIGKMELTGYGFDSLLTTVIGAGIDLVLCVRDINVQAVVERYGLVEPDIIAITD